MDVEAQRHALSEARQQGLALVERWTKMPGNRIRGYSKYKQVNFLEGINPKDHEQKAVLLATLYENTLKELQKLDETTRMLNVGSFEKFVFPIIRAVYANLVATELVTTQALTAPTGLVFFMDAIAGTQKGLVSKGEKLYDALNGPSKKRNYTSEEVDGEIIGNCSEAAEVTLQISHVPVRPGSVKLTYLLADGVTGKVVVDNGNGNLVGDVGAASKIDYATGMIKFTPSADSNTNAVTATYEFNLEANADIPEIDLVLSSAPVTARSHKLRARWSIESQQDFQAYHGINADVELVAFMANEIAKEINYKIVSHLRAIASAGTVIWDKVPADSTVPYIWHRETLYDAFIMNSNQIFAKTQRRNGTWIVIGTDVANVVETLPKFKPQGGSSNGSAGIRKIGTLGEFTIYKDPSMPTNQWLMGFKGSNFLDTGYIYAPYQGLYTTQLIVLDDMIARKAMMQRVGLKVVNPNFYATGTMTTNTSVPHN